MSKICISQGIPDHMFCLPVTVSCCCRSTGARFSTCGILQFEGICSTPSVSVNGALHLVVTQKRGNAMANGIWFYSQLDHQGFNYFDQPVGNSQRQDFECDVSYTHEIIAFDPINENFIVMPRPELVDEHCAFDLTDFQGFLGLYYYSHDRMRTEIWLRTGHDFDCPSSWNKLISISNVLMSTARCFYRIRPLCFSLENELIIHVDTGEFFLYNVVEEKFTKIDGALDTPNMGVVAFVDSLLLPGVNDKPKRRWLKTEKHDPSSNVKEHPYPRTDRL